MIYTVTLPHATFLRIKNVLEYKPFLIKPNNIELGDVFDKVLKTPDDVIPYAMKLQEMGAANVLVSLAGNAQSSYRRMATSTEPAPQKEPLSIQSAQAIQWSQDS